MTNLTIRDAGFQDLFDLRRDFDHIFNRFLTGRRGSELQQRDEPWLAGFTPAVEAYVDQENKKFVCRVALPGVDPKDVNIQVQGNMLSITGEREIDEERREAGMVHSEFAYGSFERDVMLPEGVDAQKITAEYHDGVFEITAPIAANALPRRVEIKNVEQQHDVKRMGASASGSNR